MGNVERHLGRVYDRSLKHQLLIWVPAVIIGGAIFYGWLTS